MDCEAGEHGVGVVSNGRQGPWSTDQGVQHQLENGFIMDLVQGRHWVYMWGRTVLNGAEASVRTRVRDGVRMLGNCWIERFFFLERERGFHRNIHNTHLPVHTSTACPSYQYTFSFFCFWSA